MIDIFSWAVCLYLCTFSGVLQTSAVLKSRDVSLFHARWQNFHFSVDVIFRQKMCVEFFSLCTETFHCAFNKVKIRCFSLFLRVFFNWKTRKFIKSGVAYQKTSINASNKQMRDFSVFNSEKVFKQEKFHSNIFRLKTFPRVLVENFLIISHNHCENLARNTHERSHTNVIENSHQKYSFSFSFSRSFPQKCSISHFQFYFDDENCEKS